MAAWGHAAMITTPLPNAATPRWPKSSCRSSTLVFSNLKNWLNGIHHGVSAKHLQAYLNEFTFRFNRRFYPFNAFRSLLGIAGGAEAGMAPIRLPQTPLHVGMRIRRERGYAEDR